MHPSFILNGLSPKLTVDATPFSNSTPRGPDMMIWLLRWRPDIAWRRRWKRLRNFSVSSLLHEVRFHRGYDQDNTQIMEAALPILSEAPAAEPAPEAPAEPAAAPEAPAPEQSEGGDWN